MADEYKRLVPNPKPAELVQDGESGSWYKSVQGVRTRPEIKIRKPNGEIVTYPPTQFFIQIKMH